MTFRPWRLLLVPLAVLAVSGLSEAAEPGDGAVTSLTPDFVWPDDGRFVEYRLLINEVGSTVVTNPVTVAADDPAVCPGNGECRLAAGHPAYPQLQARDYEWAIRAKAADGQSEWWGPNWTKFHAALDAPPSLTAVWNGDTIELTWPSVASAVSYRADYQHDLYAPFGESYTCSAATCTGSTNVARIPYGTVHVTLRSCSANGYCSPEGAHADATRTCPDVPAAPVVVRPSDGAMVGGLVPLQFSHVAYGERFQIDLTNATTGAPIAEDTVEYRQVSCSKGSCTRLFPLPPGSYRASVTASCGGESGPASSVLFTVDGMNAVPTLVAPTEGAQTSAYPLVAWNKILDVDRYEVMLKNVDTGAETKTVVACAEPPVCTFDPLEPGLPPIDGTYQASVRVAMETMPYSPPVTFHPSFAYQPPAPRELTPPIDANLGDAGSVAITFKVDPQVPFMSAELSTPQGSLIIGSGELSRHGSECQPIDSPSLAYLCTFSATLNQFGSFVVAARAAAPKDAVGGRTRATTLSDFTRPEPPSTGGTKATYSIYAQNMQFLPSSPLNGGGSKAYFQSDTSRADALADYILKNKFDVVALSELFTMEAKRELNKRLGAPYTGISHIDTKGRLDEVTFASITAGYFAGWWINAQVQGGLAGAYKTIADWSAEANSGLALYTRFKIKEHPSENWEENSRCTDELFNEIDDTHPDYEADFNINDRAWFRQYCHGAGDDDLSAKGIAAVELENPVTGIPLLIAWSHTQAYTSGKTFFELSSGDYSKSYEARATQVEDNAGPAVRYLVDRLKPKPFDAFILGDWNIPSPASVAALPRKTPGLSQQTDGWADTSLMFTGPTVAGDPRDPTIKSLLPDGDDAPSDSAKLFDQYWSYFDPRNPSRPFAGFYDLWLENPAGEPGFTYDPDGNKIARCHETGEPCWGKTALDKGGRYDQVLARLYGSNIPMAGTTDKLYGGQAVRAWGDRTACVQHVRLARDFGMSDHWGTIIEVGPDAPYCNPNKAKADPHLWRYPDNAPLPQPPRDQTFDAAAGRHLGNLAYGGANEWFYFSEAGGFDVVVVNKDASIPALRVDAYDARDLSTMIPVADAEQKTDQTLTKTCPQALESIAANGYTPRECATSEQRITYRSPGPFFMRIRAAAEDGSLCDTCEGYYEVLFRKRTCKVYWDAVPIGRGLSNVADRGWLGEGQPRCWFSYELAKPTLDDDPQTLTIGDIFAANDALCDHSSAGGCSGRYDVTFFDASPPNSHGDAPDEPTEEIHQPETFVAGSGGRSLVTDAHWFEPKGVMEGGVMPETGRRKFYAVVERDNPRTAHAAAFPWASNLMSVTYHALSVFDIQDDLEIEIRICLPLVGCIIDQPKDPFETEDEITTQIWTNSHPEEAFRNDHFGVDYAGGKGATFKNDAPGGLPEGCKAYQRCRQPDVPETLVGTTVNYTGHTTSQVLERDSFSLTDQVVGDPEMCGVSGNPPYFTWQATRFKEGWEAILNGAPEQPVAFEFSDDCPDSDPQFRYRLQATIPRLP